MENSKIFRCAWCGDDPLYQSYHDEEWGKPITESQKLFGLLLLESFQAGLSWITILRKRENFRQAFADFDPHQIAQFDERDVERLMQDKGIIRNRLKIQSAINGAKAYEIIEAREGFSHFIWKFVNHKPIMNHPVRHEDIPTQTPISEALSKALYKEGFRFVGPVIIYAFMQSAGLVNDHLRECSYKYD